MRVASTSGRAPSTRARILALVAILAVPALVCLAPAACGVASITYGLMLAPACVLFAVLVLGCAPGAQLLERLRAGRLTRRPRRAPRTLALRRPIVVRRMTSPAASALAMRPPPVVALVLG